MSILGDNIRKLRLEKGLRGEDLGKQFNVYYPIKKKAPAQEAFLLY